MCTDEWRNQTALEPNGDSVDGDDLLLAGRLRADAEGVRAIPPSHLRQRTMAKIRLEAQASVAPGESHTRLLDSAHRPRWSRWAAAAALAILAGGLMYLARLASTTGESGSTRVVDADAGAAEDSPVAPVQSENSPRRDPGTLAALESFLDPASGAAMAGDMVMRPLREELDRLANAGDRLIRSTIDVLPPGIGPGR